MFVLTKIPMKTPHPSPNGEGWGEVQIFSFIRITKIMYLTENKI